MMGRGPLETESYCADRDDPGHTTGHALQREVTYPAGEPARTSMLVVASSVAGVVFGFLLAVLAVGPHHCERYAGSRAVTSRADMVTYLGVGIRTSRPADNGEHSATAGAYVTSVFPDSPALGAGIRAGDLIVAIEGKPIATSGALVREVRARVSGDVVMVRLIRPNGDADLVAAELSSMERWRVDAISRKLSRGGSSASEN